MSRDSEAPAPPPPAGGASPPGREDPPPGGGGRDRDGPDRDGRGSQRRRLLRGGVLILAGQSCIHLLALVRNFMVARLLSPEEFGVAATFAVTLLLIEAASDLAMDKLLIQARDGEDPKLQRTLQAMLLVRGVLLALALLAVSGPVAGIFGVPEAQPAFAALALVPLLRGALHLDVKRLHREMRYGPDVAVNLGANAAGAAVAIGMAWAIRDYHAMLFGVIAVAAGQMLGSHLVARRRYGIGVDRGHLVRALKFGWPLMLGGLVVAATAQGDRFLVGAAAGMRDLALYAAAAMLASAPATLLGEAVRGVGLPWLASAQADPPLFERRARILLAGVAVLVIGVFGPLMLIGTEVVAAVFGAAYRAPEALMAFMALALAIRVLRLWPSLAALARGETRTALIGNLARASGLILGGAALAAGSGFVEMAAAIAAGEAIGLAAALWRLVRVHAMPLADKLRILAVPAGAFALGGAALVLLAGDPLALLAASVALALLGTAAVLLVAPELRFVLGNVLGGALREAARRRKRSGS